MLMSRPSLLPLYRCCRSDGYRRGRSKNTPAAGVAATPAQTAAAATAANLLAATMATVVTSAPGSISQVALAVATNVPAQAANVVTATVSAAVTTAGLTARRLMWPLLLHRLLRRQPRVPLR